MNLISRIAKEAMKRASVLGLAGLLGILGCKIGSSGSEPPANSPPEYAQFDSVTLEELDTVNITLEQVYSEPECINTIDQQPGLTTITLRAYDPDGDNLLLGPDSDSLAIMGASYTPSTHTVTKQFSSSEGGTSYSVLFYADDSVNPFVWEDVIINVNDTYP